MKVYYRVIGRYVNGNTVIGYVFSGSDGSKHSFNKDKTIYLIGKGLVENMRIQSADDGSVIIRGKGTNLNNLPVVDARELKARLKVIGKVTDGNKITAYDFLDINGKRKTLGLTDTVKACKNGIVNNLDIRRDDKGYRINGIGFDVKELPVRNENIEKVEKTKRTNKVKATRIKSNGVLINRTTGDTKDVRGGDVIIIDSIGRAAIIPYKEFVGKFKRSEYDIEVSLNTNYELSIENRLVVMNGVEVNKWTTVETKIG